MTDKIRILIAEDHVLARVGATTVINSQRDLMVVAEAANGRQAVELYRKHLPDVALLDIHLPILSGIEVASAIRAEFPSARLIALTIYNGEEDIRRALAAGVQAYLTKDVPRDELVNAIRSVYEGKTYIQAALAPIIATRRDRPQLTQRELEVLELVVRGLINKQIAYHLKLTEHTVKNHVGSILGKLGVQDRTQAATEAIRQGIIHLS